MVEYTREFICLAGCLSFSKAAKMLNVSQPSLSRHIADLESQLGFKLFDRNPLSLTPAGRYYLESMSDVIGRIDAVVERGRAIAAGEGGSLVVCMVPFDIGVYSNVVYEAIAQTRERLPGFSVQFYTSRTRTVFDAVMSGKADVGVLFDMPEDLPGGYVCTKLMEYPCMVWACRDNPAVRVQPARLENFADCRLVDSSNRMFSSWYDAEIAVMRGAGLEFKRRVRDVENLADFFVTMQPDEIKITSDVGITCPYNPNVVGVRFTDNPVLFSTYLIYRDDSENRTLAAFVETCVRVAERYMREREVYSFAARR